MSRVSGPAARDVAAVLLTFLVVGVVAGVLWWLLVDPATYTKREAGGAMPELELGRRFGADGWYAVLGVVLGFVAGLGLSAWRSRDSWLTTMLLVVGSAVAASVAAVVGRVLGPGDTGVALERAAVGAKVPVQLVVSGAVVYLVWPIAVLVGALMVLWSSPGTSEDEEPWEGPVRSEDDPRQNTAHAPR